MHSETYSIMIESEIYSVHTRCNHPYAENDIGINKVVKVPEIVYSQQVWLLPKCLSEPGSLDDRPKRFFLMNFPETFRIIQNFYVL